MKLRNLGMFSVGVGGMAWAALELPEVALVLIGLLFTLLAIACAAFRWGEYLAEEGITEEMKAVASLADENSTIIKIDNSEEPMPVRIYSNGRWHNLGY